MKIRDDMRKVRKKAILVALCILTFLVGTIFFPQIQDHPPMPVAACGSMDGIFMIGNTFDDQSGDLLMSAYNNMTFMDSMSFVKITMMAVGLKSFPLLAEQSRNYAMELFYQPKRFTVSWEQVPNMIW